MPKLSRRNFGRDSRLSATARLLKGRIMPSPTKRWCQPAHWPPTTARKLLQWPSNGLAGPQFVLWKKQFACAIRSTGSLCPGRRALYAVGRRQIHITSRLYNLVHLDTESATSSPSQFVGLTTASFIARVMRPRGGASSASILYRSRSSYGSTHGLMAMNSHQAKASRHHRLRRGWTYPFKLEPVRITIRAQMRRAPFPKAWIHWRKDDLVSTDRG